MKESDADGEKESISTTGATGDEDQAFHKTYQETTGAKYTSSRGHGYVLKPRKKQILQDRLEEQEQEVQRLKEMITQKDAEEEAEKEQIVAIVKEQLM